ncbi:MAG TPA: DEAD/DEAH box helicase, partial [Solirubrobacteraceae bacterium]
ASGEVVWAGAGAIGRGGGRVALYFREDAAAIGPPSLRPSARSGYDPPGNPEHELLRERLARGPCFFTDLLAELDVPAEALREALWDLVWAGEATNDAWAPLRAPHLMLARGGRVAVAAAGARSGRSMAGRSRFASRRASAQSQVQGRWSLTESIFRGALDGPEHRRALGELLLERYGIVTREQVLAEGIKGGFAMLYDTFCNLETLGICRRGYFIEGMGGAQFALPGAVERLRASREQGRALVLAAADPAQPYGAALAWPKRTRIGSHPPRRPARVAGAYVVLVEDEPVLYVERGGRGLVTLADAPIEDALAALAEAVRAGRVGKLALERIDGEPAIGSDLVGALRSLGFHSGPRKLTLSA